MAANCGGFGTGASLVNILQYVIHGNVNPMDGSTGKLPCKKLYEYESFEEIKEEMERQMKFYIDSVTRMYHFAALVFNHEWPILSASMMTESCLAKGMAVSVGGATSSGMGSMFNGVGTTADSLSAIKYLCIDK